MSFRALSAFAPALINGDNSGLEPSESAQLDAFIARLGDGGAVVDCRDVGFSKCAVTNLWGECSCYTTQSDIDALSPTTAEYLDSHAEIPREAVAEYLTLFSGDGMDFDASDFEDKYVGVYSTELNFWESVIEQWHELYIDCLPISAKERHYLSGMIDDDKIKRELQYEGAYTICDTPSGFVAFRNY